MGSGPSTSANPASTQTQPPAKQVRKQGKDEPAPLLPPSTHVPPLAPVPGAQNDVWSAIFAAQSTLQQQLQSQFAANVERATHVEKERIEEEYRRSIADLDVKLQAGTTAFKQMQTAKDIGRQKMDEEYRRTRERIDDEYRRGVADLDAKLNASANTFRQLQTVHATELQKARDRRTTQLAEVQRKSTAFLGTAATNAATTARTSPMASGPAKTGGIASTHAPSALDAALAAFSGAAAMQFAQSSPMAPLTQSAPIPSVPLVPSAPQVQMAHSDGPSPLYLRSPTFEHWCERMLHMQPRTVISTTINLLCRALAVRNKTIPSEILAALPSEFLTKHKASLALLLPKEPMTPVPPAQQHTTTTTTLSASTTTTMPSQAIAGGGAAGLDREQSDALFSRFEHHDANDDSGMKEEPQEDQDDESETTDTESQDEGEQQDEDEAQEPQEQEQLSEVPVEFADRPLLAKRLARRRPPTRRMRTRPVE